MAGTNFTSGPIRSFTDLLKLYAEVTPDQRVRLMQDIHGAMEMYANSGTVAQLVFGAAVAAGAFRWCDDDKHQISVSLSMTDKDAPFFSKSFSMPKNE